MVNILESKVFMEHTFGYIKLNHASTNHLYSLLTAHSLNFLIKIGRTLRIYYNYKHQGVKKTFNPKTTNLLTYL